MRCKCVWSADVGKAGDHTFVPAVVDSSVYAAAGTARSFASTMASRSGKSMPEQPLSGGVGADQRCSWSAPPRASPVRFCHSRRQPLLWKARPAARSLRRRRWATGLVIVRSGDHRLAAYDSFDGKRKWVYQRPEHAAVLRVTASPVLIDKYVFAGFPGGKLIAVSAENGAPLWEGTVALPKGATELDRVADVTSVPVIDGA
jgi:outer membrane protein assembly factor BamB